MAQRYALRISVLALSIPLFASIAVRGQAGTNDATFDPGSGFNGEARRMVLQADGKVVVVGGFTAFNGVARGRVARLNGNGSLDAAYATGSGFNAGPMRDLALAADGKVYACGDYTGYNGTTRNGLARLTGSGGLDGNFNAGSGMGIGGLDALAMGMGGQFYAGGSFDTFNGVEAPDLVRLNADGSRDPAFDTGLGFDHQPDFPGGGVSDIAIDQDGSLIVVGDFTFYDGLSPFVGTICRRIARLDHLGFFDLDFAHGTDYYGGVDGFDAGASRVLLQTDGRIVVGGGFTLYNGISRNGIARLLGDGSLDTSFDPGTGFNGTVHALALQPDGRVLAAGSFTSFNGTSCGRIVRLNPDGSLDETFQPGTGFDGTVRDLLLQPDGRLLACGSFTTYNGAARNRIARIFTTDAVCIPSQLTTMAEPVVSCGAVGLMLDGTSIIAATEVPSANKYQFRFTNIAGQPSYARYIAFPTRAFTLTKWITNPLKPGRTYNVEVRASFDAGTTWCDWGPSCTVRMSWTPYAPGMVRDQEDPFIAGEAELFLYPNPADGEEVRLTLAAAAALVDRVSVDVYDLGGRIVLTRTLPVAGGFVDQVLDLDPGLTSGLYTVKVRTGDRVLTERLMVRR